MNKSLVKRTILSFFGVVLIAIAVAMFRFSDFGTDPFSCFTLGIMNQTGFTFGNVQLIENTIIIIILLFVKRKYVGIGSIFGMILVGYISDFILAVLPVTAGDVSNVVRYIVLLLGILVTSTGISLYSAANLGVSPYDSLGFLIEEFSGGKIHLRYARIIADAALILCGFAMGSVIGVGTVVIAVFTGPCVAFLLEKVMRPLVISRIES